VSSKYLFTLLSCWNSCWILAMKTLIQSLKKSAAVLFTDLAKLFIKTGWSPAHPSRIPVVIRDAQAKPDGYLLAWNMGKFMLGVLWVQMVGHQLSWYQA